MSVGYWASIATIVTFFFLVLGKAIQWYRNRNTYIERVKEVTLKWPDQTPLRQGWESDGYRIAWTHLKELEVKKLEGWEVMYEVDEKNKVKYKLIVRNNPDLILMGKKNSSD